MTVMRSLRFILASLVVVAAILPSKGRAQTKKEGWVGIVFTTGIGQTNSAGTLVFNDYPVIESIDPGSPAELAGLQAGDILISLNSQDFRKNPIPMSSLIVAGNKVTFRYKRDDVTRVSTLTVAERPDGTSSRTVFNIIQPAPDRAEVTGTRIAREQAGRTRTVTLRERAAAGTSLPMVTVPMIFGAGSPSVTIAGAELTQLNDGLRELLKFKGNGIFVINVGMGTPAGQSGLKSGDVIIKAEQEIIENPGELIRVMRRTTESAMLLQVMRNRKAKNITLRW
jgi:S1-C subfamily serine protease